MTTNYAHNGLGERVAKDDGIAATYFVYDEVGHLIGEYDETGELIQETVWFGDIPVATLRPDGQSGVDVYYVHVDHLNTPRKITRPDDDEIVWRWDSDPFGETLANEDPDGDQVEFAYNLRFPGQYFDEETALHYNYFRDYDSATGRYAQSDPIGLNGGVNTYGYAGGNPLRNIDALGLCFDSLCAACTLNPAFCMENGLYIMDGAVARSGNECLQEAWAQARSGIQKGLRDAAVVLAVAGAARWATTAVLRRLAARVPSAAPQRLGDLDAFASQRGGPRNKPGNQGQFKGTDALRRENNMARDAARLAGLNREQRRILHDQISGQGIDDFQEILRIAEGIKAGRY